MFLSVFFFEDFQGEYAPRPPSSLLFKGSKDALRRKNCHVRCFHEHVRYFTKLSKSLEIMVSPSRKNVKLRVQKVTNDIPKYFHG